MNYPASVREELGDIMQNLPDVSDGRLIILRGPSGSGKTTAMRALAREHADKCDVHVVLDSEDVVSSSEAIMEICLGGGEQAETGGIDVAARNVRLVLLDEVDRIVGGGATGFAAGRLRALGDGMLDGSGESLLVLTASDVTAIDPSLLRHGRTARIIDFEAFKPSEVVEWLGVGVPTSPALPRTSMTLAELYGVRRGAKPLHSNVDPLAGSYL
jgi:SpoVK/Ycf46/Vps4 family AAA+-type ATPase